MKKYIGTLAIIFVSVFAVTLGAYRVNDDASAHTSPPGCSGSGLGITLYVSPSDAKEGDSVSYSALVFNNRPGAPVTSCDATGITTSITTPDGVSHPLSLSRTSLVNLEEDNYTNVVSYTVRASDVHSGILAATASVNGSIHQNDTDSGGGGNQGVNVTYIAPSTPPAGSPSPTPAGVAVGGSSTGSSGTYVGIPSWALPPSPSPSPVAIAPQPAVLGWPNTGIGPDGEKTSGKNIYLSIPTIGVHSLVEEVGVKSNGELTSPHDPHAVGMYNPTPTLTVIDGHRGWHEKTAVFDNLHNLKVGDKVYSKDSSGNIIKTFIVKKTQVYDKSESSKEVFKPQGDTITRLNLITCDGDWNAEEQTYAKRLVVFTEEVK